MLACAAASSQPLTFNTPAGYAGRAGTDGLAENARFNSPAGLSLDSAGNLYVADTANQTIRKITADGTVSTLAGLAGVSGSADGSSTAARFYLPQAVAVDSSGSIYVADTANHTIRKITPAGMVSTLAGSAGNPGSSDGTGAGARFYEPQGIAVDISGNVYVADTWNHTIRKITPAGVVSTLAGSAGAYGSNDGTGTNARFYEPQGVAVDISGNVYVADTANHTIRKITPGGTVTTLAGSAGNYGPADGPGAGAQFYGPAGLSVDSAGNLYVADDFNHTIRKVTPAGLVTTLAGLAGSYGCLDRAGGNARFWNPQGVAADSAGNVYVADTANGTLRKITPAGTVSTFAGSPSIGSADRTGSRARFFWPGGAAVDSAGNVYLADAQNDTIRKLTPAGEAATLAGAAGIPGSADGTGTSARFFGPQGVAVDNAGNLYVADTANHTIRRITAAGIVTTLAGTPGTNGVADGPASQAQFYAPQAVAVDGSGNVYVADTWNHTIRKISPAGLVSTLAGLAGSFGSADGTNSTTRFYCPAGIALDAAGNIFVADSFNHTIRKLTPDGASSTIAGLAGVWGNADGTNSTARFFLPQAIVAASGGAFYVTDSGNHTIRKLTPAGPNWTVTTVAGSAGLSGSADGSGNTARFSFPAGLALSPTGAFYVADRGNNTLRLGVLAANGAPAIVSQPQSQTADPGGSVTFTLSAIGLGPLSYQWRFEGIDIPGATAGAYTRTNVQPSDLGHYSVVVANSLGSVTSADAELALTGRPRILLQPQSVTVALGQGAAFSVTASGTEPLQYQWRFNGNNLPGETDSSLVLPAAWGTNNGLYSVTVANNFGTAVSADAQLAVMALQGWGDNQWNQSSVPAAALNLVAVAAGAQHNLALCADGSVLAWGDNANGQCAVPAGLTNALAVAAGGYHSLALRADGSVVAWGANDYSQTSVPDGLAQVIAIAAGTWHSLALRRDGTVVAWGDNSWGQCSVPPGLSNVLAIAAGGNHCLALKDDATVVAWGQNTDAYGNYAGQSAVPWDLTDVSAIAAGDYHSLAVRADGTVAAWGDNSLGQCSVPPGLTNVVALAGGGAHSLALEADGTLAAWGNDWEGQCDLPPAARDIVAIGAGQAHSLALVSSALPVPRLWWPLRQDHRFSALVQTLCRKHYVLESASPLSPANWIPLSTNAGNGALLLLTDPSATAQQRFYRLRQ